MSNSVQTNRWQPTRLLRSWDSLGENTGVGCLFLLQCMKVKSESEVSQLCLTLSDPMDCNPPGSSVHGIFQARVLEWDATAFSKFLSSHTQLYFEFVSDLVTWCYCRYSPWGLVFPTSFPVLMGRLWGFPDVSEYSLN